MEFLHGWSRKLVIPLLVLFSLGWLVFFVGFMLRIHDTANYTDTFEYFPEILAIAAGPVLVVFGFLHAATSGTISATVGTLTSFVSVFCCMGFGYALYVMSTAVYYSYVWKPRSSFVVIRTWSWLELGGSFIASLAWMCVLISWNFFSYHRQYAQVETIVDDEGNLTQNNFSRSRPRRNVAFAGIARKIAVVILLLLGASWCLYVAGIIEETRGKNGTIMFNDGNLSVPLPYSTWASCLVGLIVILSASGHAGSYGGASTAMGIFTSILSMLLATSVGYVGLALAMEVHNYCYNMNCILNPTTIIPKHVIYQLSGALGMCFWWACLSALWPCYFKETQVILNSRRNTRLYQQYMRHQVEEDEDVPLL